MEKHRKWLPPFLAIWLVLGSALYAYGAPFRWNSFSGMRDEGWYVAMPDAVCLGASGTPETTLTVLELDGATPSDGWVFWAFHNGPWVAVFFIAGTPYSWSHGTWDSDKVKVKGDDLPIKSLVGPSPCNWYESRRNTA